MRAKDNSNKRIGSQKICLYPQGEDKKTGKTQKLELRKEVGIAWRTCIFFTSAVHGRKLSARTEIPPLASGSPDSVVV
jgi:hypothetical protein